MTILLGSRSPEQGVGPGTIPYRAERSARSTGNWCATVDSEGASGGRETVLSIPVERSRVVQARQCRPGEAAALEKSSCEEARSSSETLESRKAAYRRILSGACIFRHGRWIAADTPMEDLAALDKAEERRLARNRRQRERMRVRREAAAFEEHVASLPPWVQTRLYGRTATVTVRNGWMVSVDYRRTYARYALDMPVLPGKRRHASVSDLFDTLVGTAAMRFDGSAFVDAFVKRWLGWRETSERRRTRAAARMRGMSAVDRGVAESVRRLASERRKVNRRATVASCPGADDIRVAWAVVHEDPEGPLRLGGLLLDLECFVDNSLVVEKRPEGWKIRGRRGGIRAWLRRNCPELAGKYKTLMRHKSLARKFRQAVDLPDPVPTAEILGGHQSAERIAQAEVHEQPRFVRGGALPANRFAWEDSMWLYDADGRPYRGNPRYVHARTVSGDARTLAPILDAARRCAKEILVDAGRGNAASAGAKPGRRWRHSDLVSAVVAAVARRERWWALQR